MGCDFKFEVEDGNRVYAAVDGKLTEIPEEEASINDAGTVSGGKKAQAKK